MNILEVPYGYCHCGCGEKTNVARDTNRKRGWVKGEPRRYVHLHYSLSHTGEHASRWKGGKTIAGKNGYAVVKQPDHPRASSIGYILGHILVAEKAMRKLLPLTAVVHHVNEIKSDNRNSNLVICQDNAYHRLLHQRTRALRACDNAAWRKCPYCKTYDDPTRMTFHSSKVGNGYFYHSTCPWKLALQRKLERSLIS